MVKFWNRLLHECWWYRGSRGKLAGKSVFLQIIGNDNANISVFSPQHRPYLLIIATS